MIFQNRRIIVCTFLLALILTLPSSAFAAKKLIRRPRAVGVTYSKASLSRANHSIVVTFLNLSKVKRIEYALGYSANGISQGVMGSFVPSGQATDSRDLYFGTCSKGVCTPHYGITRATLTITTTLNSGSVNTKRYVLKNI